MFVVVWQFEVAEEKIAGFEAAYSAEGSWAQLFRASPGYQGTELLRDAYIPGTYLTIDRWASEEAFRAFRKDHDADYEALDRACDKLTSRESASALTPSEPPPRAPRQAEPRAQSRLPAPRNRRETAGHPAILPFSPSLRYFSLSLSVQPCYNPIEIQSMPPRRFLAGKQEPGSVSIFLGAPKWRLPMTARRP